MAMFENISEFFKRFMQNDKKELLAENPTSQSKDTAKDRLHVVLMQDRANVSADFLEMMKEEIIEVIKKYIVVDETKIDVRLTNEENEDGSLGAPLLHANIPILNVRNDLKGTYMNGNSSDKIEGQQEISVEENNKKEPEKAEEQKEDKPKVIENLPDLESVTEDQQQNSSEEVVSEEVQIQESSTEENIVENIEESIEESIEEKLDDLDDEEDDDDVTFDDLLKAAEEEEERLKQKKEENKEEKKKVTPKKKKTSKKTKK